MKKYITPEAKLLALATQDIVQTSNTLSLSDDPFSGYGTNAVEGVWTW